jgi:hypothetical protein
MQLQTGYREGGKTGSYTVQLQTGYREGRKTGSYPAADRIQTWRKGRKLYSCRQDTEREERQEAVQLQTGYNQGGKTGSYAAAERY